MNDIYGVLEGKTLGDPDVLEKFGPELGAVLTGRLKDQSEKRTPTLRMSNIGTPCKRRLWYELHDYPGEELDGKTLLKFTYGALIESLVLVLAEAAGHKVERCQEEVNVDGIVGHIDAVLDSVLIDIKSCSSYSFKKFKEGTIFEDDAFGYLGQISGYAKALNLPAAWIAVDKTSGELTVLRIPQEKISAYDISGRIAEVREAVGLSDAPARGYSDEPYGESGNRCLSIQCSYCRYRDVCWKDSNDGSGLRTFFYSKKPVFMTKVLREPRVFESK